MSRVRIRRIALKAWGLGLFGFDHLILTFEPDSSLDQWHWYGIEAGRILLTGVARPLLQVPSGPAAEQHREPRWPPHYG